MDLGNPFKVIVHYLLIRWMISLGRRDRFPMVSTSMCIITYWIEPMVSYDIKLLGSHDLTKMLYCMVS